MRHMAAALVAICLVCGLLAAQSPESAKPIPLGFRSVQLGLDLETVKQLLLADPYFDYRGDPDVTLLARPNESLIECPGYLYVQRGYFQFYDNRLFVIILVLDRLKLDYYTVFTTLSERYGEPTSITPDEAVWLFDQVRLSVEQPLSVKYIDRPTFERLKNDGKEVEQLRQLSKERFLEEL